eukprot:m.62595 g.62595  ORF g.62595 m.62595 type:complete len:205 (+) comp23178_c0_seq2:319-933(+)
MPKCKALWNPKVQKGIILGLTVIALICGIVATSIPNLYVKKDGDVEINSGIWSTNFKLSSSEISTDWDCDKADALLVLYALQPSKTGTDCWQARVAKCHAVKGFAVVGVIVNAGAIAVYVLVANVVTKASFLALAAVCYCVVFGVVAGIHIGDVTTLASCGIGTAGFSLGYSFDMFVTSFLFLCLAAFFTVLFDRDPKKDYASM